MFFDTEDIEPGGHYKLFGNRNIGDKENCNLQIPGGLASDQTFIVMSMGARILGESKEAEKIILGLMRFTFTLGDHPMLELSGPCLSTLLDHQPQGYQMKVPVVVPVRQNASVEIEASKEMMEPVRVRFFLFGIATRDVA